MSRSKKAKKRTVEPDQIYNSKLITKLINRCMYDGKKDTARKQVYKSLEIIKEKIKAEDDPLKIFNRALKNIQPKMEVRSRRVGGASYQVPVPVRGDRRETLSIRWLVLSSRKRPNQQYRSYAEKLAAEIMDAYNNEGGAISKREQVEKMAQANKAFAHFRW